MARLKAVTRSEKKVAHKEDAPLTTKAGKGTPYQLDAAQVERAATALIAHMKKHAEEKEERGKKNLAADEDDAEQDQPIFLNVTTKKHVHDTSRLKPTKIPIPHSIQAEDIRICIFTKDPQRAYKDLVASDAFPAGLRAKVGRVLGVEKLKKKFKNFEQKRALLAEYDVFLVDDRVIKIVADFLGKTFYQSKSKRPIPVRLTAGAYVDRKEKKPDSVVGTPQGVAKEIENALNATYVSMSASANTSIKVGKLSMTSEQLKDNVEAVVAKVIEKHIEHGWKNVRSLHIKGPTTKALPIWLADELWADEAQVLEEAWKPTIKDEEKTSDKKRKWDEWEEELLDDEVLAAKKARKEAKKIKAKEPEEKKVSSISKEKRKKLKKDALKSVQTPLIAGS